MALVLLSSTSVCGAEALTTQKDVRVAIRAIGFVISPPTGPTPLAIIYAPDNPLSTADATAMLAYVQADARVGGATLAPVLVRTAEMRRMTGIRFALVTHGLESYYDRIATLSEAEGVLSMTADASCARCVMSVTSEPRVQVIINHTAALAAHVEFSTAFRMLIDER